MNLSFKYKKKIDYPWHLDFRSQKKLPDIKLVRTDFILNFISLVLIVSLFSYYTFLILYASDISYDIENLEGEIGSKAEKNQTYIKSSKEFKEGSVFLNSIMIFYDESINPLDYLVLFTKKRPSDIIFDEIIFDEKYKKVDKKTTKKIYETNINGSIRGNYGYALETMNDYTEALSELPEIKPYLEEIEVASLKRDPLLGLFTYTIRISLTL